MSVCPRQLDYPVEPLPDQDLAIALDVGYTLEVSQSHYKVYSRRYSNAAISHFKGYIPAQFGPFLRLLMFRLALMAACLKSTTANWGQNMLEVFALEFTYLRSLMKITIASLLTSKSGEWVCPELEEWLLLTFFIKPMQVEKEDYDHFFMSGGSVRGVDPYGLDWEVWAAEDNMQWAFIGFPDDTGFPNIKSFRLDAFAFAFQCSLKQIQLKNVPLGVKRRVTIWPKGEPYWQYLHNRVNKTE